MLLLMMFLLLLTKQKRWGPKSARSSWIFLKLMRIAVRLMLLMEDGTIVTNVIIKLWVEPIKIEHFILAVGMITSIPHNIEKV